MLVISKQERIIVTYYKSSHTITGWFLEHVERLLKVTLVPYGIAAVGDGVYACSSIQQLWHYADFTMHLRDIKLAIQARIGEEIAN